MNVRLVLSTKCWMIDLEMARSRPLKYKKKNVKVPRVDRAKTLHVTVKILDDISMLKSFLFAIFKK